MEKKLTQFSLQAKHYFFPLLVIFSFIIFNSSFSQIPNSGFESWTNGDPDGWATTNHSPTLVNVTQVSDAHNGSSAVKGEITSIAGINVPVVLISGANKKGFSDNTRADALHGWYKFNSVSGDEFLVDVVFKKNGKGIGAGSFSTTVSANNYTEFIANTFWGTQDTPDTAYIAVQITASQGTEHVGSYFILDDLAWGSAGSSGVSDEKNISLGFLLGQNEPNPSNGVTKIHFVLPYTSNYSLKLFNLLGEEVGTIANGEHTAGAYDVVFDTSNLPSGTYIYCLQAGTVTLFNKLIKVN